MTLITLRAFEIFLLALINDGQCFEQRVFVLSSKKYCELNSNSANPYLNQPKLLAVLFKQFRGFIVIG